MTGDSGIGVIEVIWNNYIGQSLNYPNYLTHFNSDNNEYNDPYSG